ncbi:MAG: hypothetical protein UT50_C0001G0069 [Candidatus Moranbacteria bacterium GW2011_GWA2_39_41]|nr:MAG: hypothetical protein UT50_C0001G0069 [Candidatus Moranbacteria bacterium GW2011_GWA2_39_41]
MLDKKKFFAILFLVVLLGGFLRMYKLGNSSFVADEFLDVNASYGYFKTGDWHAWDFNLETSAERLNDPSDERAWIYRWQMAQLYKFFPPTETTARAVSVFWGMISIGAMYLVATSFTKKRAIGLLSATLFALSVSGIIFDRHVRMYAMFFPIFLLFSWSTFKFLERKYEGNVAWIKKVNVEYGLNLMYLMPILTLGALSFHLHQLTANIAIVVAVYLVVRLASVYRKTKSWQNKYAVMLAIAVAGFVLVEIFAKDLVAQFLGTLVFFTTHWSYLAIVLRDYNDVLIAIAFAILGIYYLVKTRFLGKEALWLSISFFVPLLFAIFMWRRNVGEQYIFFIQSFEMILIATGIYAVAVFFQDSLLKYNKKPFYIAIIVAFLILPNYAYFFQENSVYQQTSRSENPNYRSVFTYFKKNKKPNDVLITRDFRNYYWSGQKVVTFDFGGELSQEKFNLTELQKIMSENLSGWFIYSGNDKDYISEDVQKYVEKNLEKINAIAVRGDIGVYRWSN